MNCARALVVLMLWGLSAQAADSLKWMDDVLPVESTPAAVAAPLSTSAIKDLPKVEAGIHPVAPPPAAMAAEAIADNRLTSDGLAQRGLLNEKLGGFNSQLWAGINRGYSDRVLSKIQDTGLQSYNAMKLLQRMLLTAAEAPTNTSAQGNWLAVRINALHALGFADAGRALLRGLSKPETLPPDVAQVWVESNLMTGDAKRACQYVKQQVLNTDAPFWRQTVMVCQALQGDKEGLRLSLDAASDDVKNADLALTQLLRIAHSDKGIVPTLKTRVLPPLQAVVVRVTPLLLTERTALSLPDALQREVANDTNLSLLLRTKVAENLVATYGLREDLQSLQDLYNQYGFTDEELTNAQETANRQGAAVSARALLWQASAKPELDTDRALLLQNLWDRAAMDGLPLLAVSLSPDLRNIKPTPALAWFAPDVMAAQLQVGHMADAEPWWRVLNENQSLSQELQNKRAALNLLFGVVNGDLKPEDLRMWWKAQNLTNPVAQANVLKVLTLLEAMGQTVPADIWQTLHSQVNDAEGETGHAPGGLWLRMVGNSLDAGHSGEAMLLLLEPLEYVTLAALAPQAIGNIVTGFKFMNMTAEAKAFALEALLGPSDQQ